MKVKNILFYFLSIIISFSSLQTTVLGATNSINLVLVDNDFFHVDDTNIKTLKEREIAKYIDKKTGRLIRKRIEFVESMFISDDDEIAKKEIEQAYFLGFFKTGTTHIGEEVNFSNFYLFVPFMLVSFFVFIVNWLTSIVFTLPLMILVKLANSSYFQKTGEYIQDLIINKILFSDGEKSLAFIILAICTICALLITLIRSFKLKPSKVLKNLAIVLCMSITIGTFMQNTISFHKTLERAIQQPLDSLFCTKKMDNSIMQKSLIFNIFQEQSFLLRHFGVGRIEDISTLGNNPGDKSSQREEIETPNEQYERLLLGYPEGKEKFGTENYAIHQALEPKDDLFQDKATKNGCANTCIKRSGRDVEGSILLYCFISTLLMFPSFIVVFILLIALLFVTLTSYLKPITSLFSCFKCVLEANFKMFFNILFNTITWILFLPLIKSILNYIILANMKIISYARNEPIFAIVLSFVMCASLIHICRNIRTYFKYFTDILKGVSKFSLDAIDPHSNAVYSINNKIIQPAVSGVKDKAYDLFYSNELNGISESEKNNINGDEDIIGESCIEEISTGVQQNIKRKKSRNNTEDNLTNPTKEDSLTNPKEEDVNKDTTQSQQVVSNVIDTELTNNKNMSNDKDEEVSLYLNEQNNEENKYDNSQETVPSNEVEELSLNIEKDNPKYNKDKTEKHNLSDFIEKNKLNNSEKTNNFELQNDNKNISIINPVNTPITLDEEKEKIKADIFNGDEEIMSKKMFYAQRKLTRKIYRKKIIPKKDKKK